MNMLESMNDYISIGVLFLFILLSVRLFFQISSKQRIAKIKERENRYLAMLEEAVDDMQTEDDDED